MTSPNFEIRNLSYEDIEEVTDWSQVEGWNPGVYDAEIYSEFAPGDFYGGFLNDQLVCSLSAVNYQSKICHIGFRLVRPEFKDKGYDTILWEKVIQGINAEHFSTDSVAVKEEEYKKLGFTSTFKHTRYMAKGLNLFKKPPKVRKYRYEDLEELINYDKQFFPADRSNLLELWVQTEDLMQTYIRRNTDGFINGVATVRQSEEGYRIGPLYADNFQAAEELFLTCANYAGNQETVFLDAPSNNNSAIRLAGKYRMKQTMELTRHFSKAIPELPYEHIYSVTSIEIG